MPPKPKFADNEKVLCYHGPLLYEAKTVKHKKDTKGGGEFLFFIHYQGWNKNWDEWVAESRILKINPENLERKQKLLREHNAAVKEGKKKNAKKGEGGGPGGGAATPAGAEKRKSESANTSRASTPVSERSVKTGGAAKRPLGDDERSTSSREEEPLASAASAALAAGARSAGKRDTKRWRQEQRERRQNKDSNEKAKEFEIEIPEELKYVLVSDWNLVVHGKSLFKLPAKVTAATILADYVKHVEKQKGKVTMAQEITLGIKDYFNHYLKKHLLYDFERKQYEEAFNDGDEEPADVYGSAHLLRLMVKMNAYLKETGIDQKEDIQILEDSVHDFLDFLDTSRAKYFTSKNYSEASSEYLDED